MRRQTRATGDGSAATNDDADHINNSPSSSSLSSPLSDTEVTSNPRRHLVEFTIQNRTHALELAPFAAVSAILAASLIFLGYFIGAKSNLLPPSNPTKLTLPPVSPSSTIRSAKATKDDFDMAFRESYGFFNDISQKEWELHKKIERGIRPNVCSFSCGISGRSQRPDDFFQSHFEPEFSCRHERRIGMQGDGGKWVCDPHRIPTRTIDGSSKSSSSPPPPCLVYSVGSRDDFSFETEVLRQISNQCEIHTFDMGSFEAKARRAGVHYHQWGISGRTFTDSKTGEQYKTITDTFKELGHVGRTIDIFKIDCEGCELDSYHTWVNQSMVMIRQVLVEVHGNQTHVHANTKEFFTGMHDNGYVMFHKEPNIQFWTRYDKAVEFAFLKLSPQFFSD